MTEPTTVRNESSYHKEREKKVLELYHTKGKRYSYITKELKISPNTINAILKRDREEKEREKAESQREKQSSVYNVDNNNGGDDDWNGNGNGNGNGDARARSQKQPQMQQQQQQLQQYHQTAISSSSSSSLPIPTTSAAELRQLSDNQKAAIAYKLYDQYKTPVDVATILCVTANEAIRYYRDFIRLQQHHQLYRIFKDPEIQPYLPSFIKLFKELKRQGLNPQNVKWFVDGLNIGTIKIEDVYADYEDAKANNQNLRNEHENLTYENQSLRGENQDIINRIQYNRRIFENDSKAMKEQTAELIKLQKQQQQNVDTLSERIATLYNKERELNVRVSRFKDINKTYRKVKTIAQEQVNRFWSQALKEPDKKMVFTIMLS
jgi:hypothetical protein